MHKVYTVSSKSYPLQSGCTFEKQDWNPKGQDLKNTMALLALHKCRTSLIHLLLHIINTQPGDDIHIHWPIPVGFQMVVEGLRLIASLVEKVGQSRQHTFMQESGSANSMNFGRSQ